MTRVLGDDWLVPALDPDNRAFFTTGRITAQRCDACGAFQHPPEEMCGACQGVSLTFQECGDTGRVESVAVVHHPLHPDLAEHCPYAIVVVSVDGAPGVNLIGNVRNRAPHEVAIGQRVCAAFEEVADPESGDTLRIPEWEVVDA